jgi:inner membrane protein YidH
MSAAAHQRRRSSDAADDGRNDPSIRHYLTSEHLANERTHLAYITTAISLVSLGIAVNRFSVYLIETGGLDADRRPLGVLRDIKQIGLGMVLFGFLLMVLSLHRYLRVDRAIDRLDCQPERRLVKGLTLTSLLAGALGIIWMFLR